MRIPQNIFDRFIQGYSDGFEHIFESYIRPLVHFTMRYGVSRSVAEDISMEVLHKVWCMRSKVESPAALNSLLYISVKNMALNTLRSNFTTEPITIDFAYSDEISDKIFEEECYNAIYNAINNLSPQAKEVIILSIEGKSITEISQTLSISESSVKTYKRRAITYLTKMLKDDQKNNSSCKLYILICVTYL